MDFNEEEMFGEKQAIRADDGIDSSSSSRKRMASSTSSSDSEDAQETMKAKPFVKGKGRGTRPIGTAVSIHRRSAQGDNPVENIKNKLGTSMPINIRQSPAHAATKVHEQKDDEHRANTFVAFHSMDQPVDYSLKAASLSNGSVAKRERLLQRNKILRRTGFIESETQLPGGGKGSEPAFPELMDPLNRRMLPIKESHLEPSALSAALGSPNLSREAGTTK